jgi:hypothetical protein
LIHCNEIIPIEVGIYLDHLVLRMLANYREVGQAVLISPASKILNQAAASKAFITKNSTDAIAIPIDP